MMKSGAPRDKVRVRRLPIEFSSFTNRFKGYLSLVPGIISIFFGEGMGPFNF